MGVDAGLHVNGYDIGSGCDDFRDMPFWIGSEEVDIEGKINERLEVFDKSVTVGDHGCEVAVHDIDVDDVGAPFRRERGMTTQLQWRRPDHGRSDYDPAIVADAIQVRHKRPLMSRVYRHGPPCWVQHTSIEGSSPATSGRKIVNRPNL